MSTANVTQPDTVTAQVNANDPESECDHEQDPEKPVEHDEYDTDEEYHDRDEADTYSEGEDEEDEEGGEEEEDDEELITKITQHLEKASACDLVLVQTECDSLNLPFVTPDTFMEHARKYTAWKMFGWYKPSKSWSGSKTKLTPSKTTRIWRNHMHDAYVYLHNLEILRSCPNKLTRLRKTKLRIAHNYAEYQSDNIDHRKLIANSRSTSAYCVKCVEYTCGCTQVNSRDWHCTPQTGWIRCEPHAELCAKYEAAVDRFNTYCSNVKAAVDKAQAESKRSFSVSPKHQCLISPGDKLPVRGFARGINLGAIRRAYFDITTAVFADHLDPQFDELYHLTPVDLMSSVPSIYPWNNRARYVRARAEYMREAKIRDTQYV